MFPTVSSKTQNYSRSIFCSFRRSDVESRERFTVWVSVDVCVMSVSMCETVGVYVSVNECTGDPVCVLVGVRLYGVMQTCVYRLRVGVSNVLLFSCAERSECDES